MPTVAVLSMASMTYIVGIYFYNIKIDSTNCKIDYIMGV
jgi:hypothetical protein